MSGMQYMSGHRVNPVASGAVEDSPEKVATGETGKLKKGEKRTDEALLACLLKHSLSEVHVDLHKVAEAMELKPKSVRIYVGDLRKSHGIKVKLISKPQQQDDGTEDATTPKKRKIKDATHDGSATRTPTSSPTKKAKAAAKIAEVHVDEGEIDNGSDVTTPTPYPKKVKQTPKKSKQEEAKISEE